MQAIAKAAARKRQATNSQSIPEKIREDINDYDSIMVESDAADPIQKKAEAIMENAERFIQARKDPKPEPVYTSSDELIDKLESLTTIVKESQSKSRTISIYILTEEFWLSRCIVYNRRADEQACGKPRRFYNWNGEPVQVETQ